MLRINTRACHVCFLLPTDRKNAAEGFLIHILAKSVQFFLLY